MRDNSPASQFGRPAQRALLTIAVYLSIGLGPALLIVPFTYIFYPDRGLLGQKLVSVMGGVAVVVAVGLGMWLIGALLRRRLLRLRQSDNDRVALEIMSDLRANRAARVPEFYLYLRAFETTGRLHVPLFLRLRKFSIGLNQLVTNDVEGYVSSAIKRVAPLVALGSAGEAIGAGRIVTDDDHWKADIRTLMDRAKAILVVPSDRPGTTWEIETLKSSDLLHKVIFIIPPRSRGAFDTRARWEAAQQALAAYGLETPDYQERGLLFVVGANGKVSNVEPMLLPSPRQVRKSLKRLLSVDRSGGLFNAIARAERRSRRGTYWGWAETLRQFSPCAIAALGLLVAQPEVGFNPRESWATVFDRSMTAAELDRDNRDIVLARSDKYRALEAQAPPERRDQWQSALLIRGLGRVSDEELRSYHIAFGEMLTRVDVKTCAAIVRGDIRPDAMAIALTYIPSNHVYGYLKSGTDAILAAVEDRPLPARDAATSEAAGQAFLTQLGPTGQQRYERLVQTPGLPSDDDRCWLARAMHGSVATLPAPHASVWARDLVTPSPPTANATAESEKAPPPAQQDDRASRGQTPASAQRTDDSAIARAAPPPKTRTPQPFASAPREDPSHPDPNPAPPAPDPKPVAPSNPIVEARPPERAGPSYAQLLDGVNAAIGSGRVAEAGDLIDRLIRLDPARSDGWSLRGFLELSIYGDVTAARDSFESALLRGGRAAVPGIHDHSGAGQQRCAGILYVTPTGVEYRATSGDHQFDWPYPSIREAAVNDIYGSQLGMFHIKAQMSDGVKNFNFAVVRSADQRLVNHRPDAEMLLGLVNRRRPR